MNHMFGNIHVSISIHHDGLIKIEHILINTSTRVNKYIIHTCPVCRIILHNQHYHISSSKPVKALGWDI